MAKLSKTQRRALELLKKRVRYEKADISFSEGQIESIRSHYRRSATPEIREATKLYTETWIVSMIDTMLAEDTDLLKSLVHE